MSRPTFVHGDRIRLVPPAEADLAFLREGVNHPKVREYIGAFRRPYTEDRYREELWSIDTGQDGGVTLLVVPTGTDSAGADSAGANSEGADSTGADSEGADPGDPNSVADDPVGSVQLSPIVETDGYANFGVWLHPDAWGNGYAVDSGAHLIEYGFRELGLHRISATAVAPNEASTRLCERLGFAHEGAARESQLVDGEYVDVERYGLLEGEWEGPAAVLDGD